MQLTSLSDESLVTETRNLVGEERHVLTAILHHLREIHRRRVFSALGYKSLFDFVTRHLGYAEDAAYRRINAMKLLTQMPEIEEQVARGDLTLTHLSLAQSLFRQERKISKELSHDKKLEVFREIANQPVRIAEKIALGFSSQGKLSKPDQVKCISLTQVEMSFFASDKLPGKITTLKGFFAHTDPEMTFGELFEKLCDLELQRREKSVPPRKLCVRNQVSKAALRREVFKRAGSRCENCHSTYALEVDHMIPQAKGGLSELKNFRVLCRSCNQRAAIQEFGLKKMDRHIN